MLKKNFYIKFFVGLFFSLIALSFSGKSYAGICKVGDNIFIHPPAGIFSDVDWAGIFPIRVGGKDVVPGIPGTTVLPPTLIGNIPAQSTSEKIPAGG